jgi:hypothetical protein
MDGNKPGGTKGRMAEYASSAYVEGNEAHSLSQPLNVRSGARAYVPLPLDGSDQFIEEGGPIPSPGTPFPISLYQKVVPQDSSLTNTRYRIVIMFIALTP